MPKRYPISEYDYDDRRERSSNKREDSSGFLGYSLWTWLGVGAGLILVLLLLASLGVFKSSDEENVEDILFEDYGNLTALRPKMLPYIEMQKYILASQEEGFRDEDIIIRLQLSGFTDSEIEKAYLLTDPYVVFILDAEADGWTRREIVEHLFDNEVPPEDIIRAYDILEDFETSSFGEVLRDYWPLFLLGLGAVYYLYTTMGDSSGEVKLSPKVYTLDECEEYAREYLDKKGKPFNPSYKYRNRPDIRQYRFVYEEPLFPEFNDHHAGSGFKVAKRKIYLIAISYDCEVIDYAETFDDNRADPFLYAAPKGFEQAGSKEYMGLRARSEQPMEEKRNRGADPVLDDDGDSRPYSSYSSRYSPYRRKPISRYRPINTGWED